MPTPRRDKTSAREKNEILDYINAMSLELAQLADHAGCTALGDYLRGAPDKGEVYRGGINPH